MQLISTLLFLFSLVLFIGALTFLVLWHRLHRKGCTIKVLREGIGHVGISAIVEYPDTPAPLISLLEEEYPRSEAIVVTDLQNSGSAFMDLIGRFHLVKVNHSHLKGVRALYRSHHRAFKRVVMVDLPTNYSSRATDIAKRVASFDYVLHLPGECQIEYNTLTYCANIIALHPATKAVSLKSIVGAGARLERADHTPRNATTRILTDRALAWRKSTPVFLILAITTPAVAISLAHFSGEQLLAFTAITICLTFGLLLYVSCRVITKKGLYATTNIIIKNFCRFLVERMKNFYYLYKERDAKIEASIEIVELQNKIQHNREQS